MILLLFSFILTFAIGFITSNIFFSCRRFFLCHTSIKVGLGCGLGFGLTSFFSFILLLAFNHLSLLSILLSDIALFLVLLVVYVRTNNFSNQQSLCAQYQQKNVQPTSLTEYGMIVALIIVGYIAVLSFVLWSTHLPHGAWDAWSIWNANARFIYRGGTLWKQALTSVLLGSSTDYPWMYPVTISRLWFYAGQDTILAPIIVSAIYTFGSVLLLGSSILILATKRNALLAAIVLLATPFFILHAASQQADIPLGYYFLATMIMWQLYIQTQQPRLLLLCGCLAGLAMFMKNEGIFFIIMFSMMFFCYKKVSKITAIRKRTFLLFILGVLPFIITNLWMRAIAPHAQFVAKTPTANIYFERVFDLSRHEIAIAAFWYIGKSFTQFAIPLWLLYLFYLLVAGISIPKQQLFQRMTILFQILLMLVGYYAIYIVISPDIVWHIKSSLDRLYLQLWPMFLLFYFLVVGEKKQLKNTEENEDQYDKHQKIRNPREKREKAKKR